MFDLKKAIVFLLVGLLAPVCHAVNGEDAQKAMAAFVGDSLHRHASMSIALYDIDADTMVACYRPDVSCITASTMKTITSSTALCLLGPNYTFNTRVYLLGEQKGKKFKGNIFVEGAGDPTLGSKYFPNHPNFVQEIVDALKAKGIEKVEGELVVDSSLMPWPGTNGWWEVGDLAWYYGAGIYGFNFLDNCSVLKFTARDGAILNPRFEPAVPGVQVVNKLAAGVNLDNVDLRLEEGTSTIVLHGSAANKDYSIPMAIPAPAALFVDSLSRTIKAQGFKLKIKHLSAEKLAKGDKALLVEHRSPALSEIITSLLDRSDNMFTDGVLRAVALHARHQATARAGIEVVDSLWRSKGIDTEALFQYDGSGLAAHNRASSRFFVEMLSYMAKHPVEGVTLSQLMPEVRRRIGKLIPETPLATNLVVKSGSINNVQTFVGYFPAKRPRYAWALLVNNWNGTRAALRDRMDVLLINLFGQSKIE
ncbi:MAG: D-alanyl-D-alanine carboxypeptidase/D-alanyl-D-alanine-endopeptidase [Sodaliphilus sp.]